MTKGGKQGTFRGRECHGRSMASHTSWRARVTAGDGVQGGRGDKRARREGAREPGDQGVGGGRTLAPRSPSGLHAERLWERRAPLGNKPQDSSRVQLAFVISCPPRRGFSPGPGMPQGRVTMSKPPCWPQAAASTRGSSYHQLTWPQFPAAPLFPSSPPTLELEATRGAASHSWADRPRQPGPSSAPWHPWAPSSGRQTPSATRPC